MDINLNINEKFTEFDMGYHYGLYEILKQSPESKFDFKKRNWIVKNEYVKDVLEQFKKEDIPVSSLLADVKEKIKDHKESKKEEEETTIKTNKINVKESGNKLQISFKFDRKILEQIKKMSYRRWNNQFKVWEINKDDVGELIELLNELEYVDLTELEKYCGNVEEIELNIPKHCKINPFPYQLENSKRMLQQKKMLNASDMGLGKTLQAILATENIEGKKVIICPSSLKFNWRKEIRLINPYATVHILEGKSEYPKLNDNDYMILNYDIINRFIAEILKEDFKVSVFDESHMIKAITNGGKPSSKRAKFGLQIAESTEYTYMLSGTPITNGAKDLFNTLKAIKHPLSRNWFAFANKYCDPERSDFGVKYNGASNQDELNEKLKSKMIRMKKEDVLDDLPEKTRSFIPVSIDLKSYNRKVKEYMDKRVRFNDIGEHLVHLSAMRRILAQAKTKNTIELTQDMLEQGKSVVIFTNYTDVVKKLMKKFEGNAVCVTGDVSAKKRQENVEKFQNGEVKVFIGNVEAAGTGLTLTKASVAIQNDVGFTISTILQSEDRTHRIGQKDNTHIFYMYAEDTVDQELMTILEKKMSNISTIIDGDEESFVNELINKL